MSNDYNVVLLDELSLDQQILVYKQAFNNSTEISELRSLWKKKHYQNPYGNSLIFGVFIDGELAGMNAYMPYSFCYNGKEIRCLQSCESGVSPNYQGKGIWGRIVRYAVDYVFTNTEYEFIFGFPNYRNSYPGFVKMRWDTVGQMNNYVMVNNASNFIKSISSNRILPLFSFPLLFQKVLIKIKSTKRLSVTDCSIDDLLWINSSNTVYVNPSLNWIKWKKDYKKQSTIAVKENNLLLATCIYVQESYNNQHFIRIDNITFSEAARSMHSTILATLICNLFKKCPKSAFIRVWAKDGDYLNRLFKKLFFLKSSHPNPFIIKSPNNQYNGLKWNLSFYDLD